MENQKDFKEVLQVPTYRTTLTQLKEILTLCEFTTALHDIEAYQIKEENVETVEVFAEFYEDPEDFAVYDFNIFAKDNRLYYSKLIDSIGDFTVHATKTTPFTTYKTPEEFETKLAKIREARKPKQQPNITPEEQRQQLIAQFPPGTTVKTKPEEILGTVKGYQNGAKIGRTDELALVVNIPGDTWVLYADQVELVTNESGTTQPKKTIQGFDFT